MGTREPDLHRMVARLAAGAAAVAVAIPLLPLYGFGGHLGFIFSVGFGPRNLVAYFLGRWTTAIAVVVGIVFLRRDRLEVAGGIFLAVALVVAISIAEQVIITAPHFGLWQTDLVLALEIVQAVLLALAALRVLSVSTS